MKKSIFKKFTAFTAAFTLLLTGCSNTGDDSSNASTSTSQNISSTASADESEVAKTVEITDSTGTVTVPVNPKNVVALDNRTFETLSDWGIELAAVPKGVMPSDSPYVADENVQDIGNHSDPNLEIIAAVNPELVIVGQRFVKYYDDIKKLVPNAAVIDLNFDVSDEDGNAGENLINGFKNTTLALGKIFDKNTEAEKLVSDFDESVSAVKSAYKDTETVMSVIVSGGNIGYSAPNTGRVWGPLYQIFGWKSSLDVDGASSDHQGDEISVEAIAQSNPDWIFVLDRDAAISSVENAVPAKDVIDNAPALQNTTAVKESHIIYAPNDTYTNESIQTFIELFNNIASQFAN